MDVDEDGFVSVMDSDGNTREDLKLPDKMQQPPPVRSSLTPRAPTILAARAPHTRTHRQPPEAPRAVTPGCF